MKLTRILLADDHTLLRAGLRALLERLPGVSVVAEAGDGRETISQIAATNPNIVLLDITMPGLNGLEALPRIRHDFPRVKSIILSMHSNEEYVIRAMWLGAAGFLLKNGKPPELELAIKSVSSGQTYLSPTIASRVADYLRRLGEPAFDLAQLTPRQREVLQLVAEGRTNKEIGATLELSVKTVEMHRTRLMKQLDLHDVAGLVRYAIRTGLISSEK